MKHTATPWKYSRIGNTEGYRITDLSDNSPAPARAIGIANAEYIVRACNSHDELLEAARGVLKQWGQFGEMDIGQKYEMQNRIKALDSIIGAITHAEGNQEGGSK